MGIVSRETIEFIYEIGIKCYKGELRKQEAKELVCQSTNINYATCHAHFMVLFSMLEGVEYHRTASAFATEYYLNCIERDFGLERRKRAAYAVGEHAKYYATLGHGHQRAIEELAKKYM